MGEAIQEGQYRSINRCIGGALQRPAHLHLSRLRNVDRSGATASCCQPAAPSGRVARQGGAQGAAASSSGDALKQGGQVLHGHPPAPPLQRLRNHAALALLQLQHLVLDRVCGGRAGAAAGHRSGRHRVRQGRHDGCRSSASSSSKPALAATRAGRATRPRPPHPTPPQQSTPQPRPAGRRPRTLDRDARDVHGARLADAVRAVDGLLLHGGVVPQVCRRQREGGRRRGGDGARGVGVLEAPGLPSPTLGPPGTTAPCKAVLQYSHAPSRTTWLADTRLTPRPLKALHPHARQYSHAPSRTTWLADTRLTPRLAAFRLTSSTQTSGRRLKSSMAACRALMAIVPSSRRNA